MPLWLTCSSYSHSYEFLWWPSSVLSPWVVSLASSTIWSRFPWSSIAFYLSFSCDRDLIPLWILIMLYLASPPFSGQLLATIKQLNSFFLLQGVQMGSSSVTNHYLQFGMSALITYTLRLMFEIDLWGLTRHPYSSHSERPSGAHVG